MSITAKAWITRKEESIGLTTLVFTANYANGANRDWATSTPYLEFKMTVKPEVADLFPLGSKWTVPFELDEE